MAGKKKAAARRKTQKLNVWLSPEQIEFLKTDQGGPSAAVRALITEAMKSGAKKKRK